MFLSVLGTMILASIIICGVVYYCYSTGEKYDKFKKDGVRVEAKVLSMEKVGASGTGNTKMKMILSFESQSGPVQVSVKKILSPQNLIKIMRENTAIIYYMPDDPDSVFVATIEME